MMEATKLHGELAQFCGSDTPTIHVLCRNMLMSEGVIYLREHANAFWLLDAIASHYAANEDLRKVRADDRDFDYQHFWVLKKKGDGGATLICQKDKGHKAVVEQEIESTDFPFQGDEFMLYAGLTAVDNVEGRPTIVYLPSEH